MSFKWKKDTPRVFEKLASEVAREVMERVEISEAKGNTRFLNSQITFGHSIAILRSVFGFVMFCHGSFSTRF